MSRISYDCYVLCILTLAENTVNFTQLIIDGLLQLLTILIAASFVQIFVVGQTVDEETVNDELTTSESSYLRELLNVLTHKLYVKQKISSEGVDVSDSAEYISEENRPSRNIHVAESSQLCEMSRHLYKLPHDEYEYRPSFYYEVKCRQHDSRKSVFGLTAQPDQKVPTVPISVTITAPVKMSHKRSLFSVVFVMAALVGNHAPER
ncbi:hypothetical protein CBL_05602 [Carabus blaptoides fortunei]